MFDEAALREALSGILGGEAALERLKTLTVGGASGLAAQGQQPENLEFEAHNWLWSDNHFRFVRRVPEIAASATKHEYQVVTGLGGSLRSGGYWTGEAGLGKSRSYKTKRVANNVAIMNYLNKVSGTARAIRQVQVLGSDDAFLSNRASTFLYHYANKTIQSVFSERAGSRTSNRFDGLFAMHLAEHQNQALYPNNAFYANSSFVVDKRGSSIERKDIENAQLAVSQEGWGQLTDLHCAPAVAQMIQEQLQLNNAVERVFVNEQAGALEWGAPVGAIRTQQGTIEIIPENWWHPDYVNAELTADYNDGAPAAPAAAAFAVAQNAGAQAGSLFQAADVAGGFVPTYKISANIDKHGVGAASAGKATGALAVGESVSVTVTMDPSWDSVEILRNDVSDPAKYYSIAELPNDAAQKVFVDLNHKIPGTYSAFAMQWGPGKQSNLMELPQSHVIESCVRFATLRRIQADPLGKFFDGDAELIVEECCPELVFPFRFVRFENIGYR